MIMCDSIFSASIFDNLSDENNSHENENCYLR